MSIESCDKKMYKAFIYLRLSKDDEMRTNESESIGHQRLIVHEFTNKQNDITIVGEEFDDGYTGTNYDRPGFQAMLLALESGLADCVIVKDLSRLGRDYLETGLYIRDIFPKMNVRFIAINDGIDTIYNSTADKNLVIPIKNLMNDTYSVDISTKIKSVVDRKKEKVNLYMEQHLSAIKKERRKTL